MPSRKSQSSDAPPSADSRRSSMRRLSSIASLHALNPFSRRRSNNATDASNASCSSNVSLQASSITTATPSDSRKPTQSSSQIFPDLTPLNENMVPPPPPPASSQANFLRRSSYMCLPDDPIGGMPRSRTFSNLPIPTRAKKSTRRAPSPSQSQASSGLVPSTRLPTPPASTRKHVPGSLPLGVLRAHGLRTRMRRADTMPLLTLNTDQVSNMSRSTAFKENISLSPPRGKTSGEDLDFSYSLPTGSYVEDEDWEPDTLTALPRHPSFSGALPTSRYTVSPATTTVGSSPIRHPPKYFSSPTYHGGQGRHPSIGLAKRPVPVQRWNSQPILTSASGFPIGTSSTHHHEIRQTRLLSARQAPTPPPITASLSSTNIGTSALRSSTGSISHLRSSSHASLLTSLSPPSPRLSVHQVATAEPPAYWCGRISALLDRYHNEDLAVSVSSTHKRTASNSFGARPKAETDKLHTPAANTARLRKALEYLHSQCTTDEARNSFVKFQLQFASIQNMPELSRPIVRQPSIGRSGQSASNIVHSRKMSQPAVGGRSALARSFGRSVGKTGGGDCASDVRNSDDIEGSVGKNGVRKISLLDRMLGRKEKRGSLS